MAREVEPKLANNFLKSDNPGVVMTSAEVKFLMAEATVKNGTLAVLWQKIFTSKECVQLWIS